ncbi:MAG: PPOX class F420-dependent oxidoreductase [Deltaproteobacteria bacterium]|nr:PPOX class F420-dependent oxidoreductase [Deltaproteobacteria bacterium]
MDSETFARFKYCQLVTFRRNGTRMPTPVWFAVRDGRLLVKTETPSGKVKRIRNDARVEVAPCTLRGGLRGPFVAGHARMLPAAEESAAEAVLRRRYGVGRKIFSLVVEPFFHLRGQRSVYLEIAPSAEVAR